MKRVYSVSRTLVMVLLFLGCDDVFEEDISDDVMTVVSPKDDQVIIGNSVTYRWSPLEGADNYRVQVSREPTSEIVLDSLVSSGSLAIQMESGTYDWRVRGENFAYVSSYSFPERFSVESTNDLSEQRVFLNSPSENFYSKNNTVILDWGTVQSAESYRLQVEKTVGDNTSVVLQQQDILNVGYTLDSSVMDEDAVYKWSVKAVNENSETPFSSRTLFLDTTVPGQPILTAPNDNATVSTTVNFTWNLGDDTGEVQSPLESLLEISTDENFTAIARSYTIEEGGGEQQHTFPDTGDYYWRVRIMDSSGNQGVYSETRSITVE